YPVTYHQMQGTVSGPVVIPKLYNGRNRTFFLLAIARHHEKSDEPQTGSVPDLNMLNGDFSFPLAAGGGYPIYDPKSMTQSGTTWTATVFPNMQVPKSRFDPVAVNFLALNPWKPPTTDGSQSRTGPSNNWIGETLYRAYRTRTDVKIDQEI